MKESFSKYLAILILLGLATLILVSSRKVGTLNINSTSDTSNTSNIDSNLDSTGTKDNLSPVQAEQSGSSPESGATSRLKQVHDWLVSKGTNYGNAQPADWSFDFGTYWNRILYSAFWEPDGTATESDVREGKTFYSGSNNRIQKQGHLYPQPTLVHTMHNLLITMMHASDYRRRINWINTNSSSGNQVWYDTRTGLYWARSQPTLTNSFSSPSTGVCDF